MAGYWIDNDSLTGIWVMHNGLNKYACTYHSVDDKENSFIRACVWTPNGSTNILNQNYAKFRFIYMGNASAHTGAASIAWYKIIAVQGYTSTFLGNNSFKHVLAPCHSSFTDPSYNDAQRSLTFQWEEGSTTPDYCLWGFWNTGNGTYNIVNKQSWAERGTNDGAATGNVQYLTGGAQMTNSAYNSLVVWGWSLADNFENEATWTLIKDPDVIVKRSNNSWSNQAVPYVKVNGVWRPGYATYIKINGVWRQL